MPIKFFYGSENFRLRRSTNLKIYFSEEIKRKEYFLGDVHFIFVNDQTLLDINKEFMGHNYFTDIITFDYNINKTVNSEIYISLETVFKNSIKYNVSFKIELLRVMVHGILHLIGYDDKTDYEIKLMREEEDNWIRGYLKQYGKIDF
jgi:rRNA maturation RNase YbeY